MRLVLCIFASCLFIAAGPPSSSDPVGDFFRRLGNSIAHPGKHPTPKPHTDKSHAQSNASANASPTPSPSPTPEAEVVRRASVFTGKADFRRDLPYAIPVANRPGFVTSPYAPTQGVVDVRGIAGGTQVKDPFTGKFFLTP